MSQTFVLLTKQSRVELIRRLRTCHKVPHLGLADGVEEGEELGAAEGVIVH